MKNVKTRQSIFETNSSSSHSVVISSNVDLWDFDDLKVHIEEYDDNGKPIIRVEGDGEYGWGYDTVRGLYNKLDYINIALYGNNELLEKVAEEIEKHIGLKVIFNINPQGYIDHQSQNLIVDEVIKKENLIPFLFSSGSYLIIDHDNH